MATTNAIYFDAWGSKGYGHYHIFEKIWLVGFRLVRTPEKMIFLLKTNNQRIKRMKKVSNPLRRILLSTCLIITISPATLCANQPSNSSEQSPAIFSSIWELPHLYQSKDNSYVQKFDLVGRYHGQYWWADSETNKDDAWENRRMYVGFNTKFFNNFTLEVQISLNDDFDPVYDGLYDAFIKWQNPESKFAVSIGRLDYVYTGMERSTSSKRIKTMERALLVNQVMPGEVVGLYIKDTIGTVTYQAGLFSGSIKDEFTNFEGGFASLLGLHYPLPLFYEQGSLQLEYLYNNGNEKNNAFKDYENIFSLWHEGQLEALAFGIDLTLATGLNTQSDVFGLTLLPTYNIAHNLLLSGDELQVAMRYHYASSSENSGLSFNKRYEQPVTSGHGDSYNAFYLGLNYFLYQQELKLMGGVEYFDMHGVADTNAEILEEAQENIDGWSITTGIRLFFLKRYPANDSRENI